VSVLATQTENSDGNGGLFWTFSTPSDDIRDCCVAKESVYVLHVSVLGLSLFPGVRSLVNNFTIVPGRASR
jgi:hypothetical protein